MWNHIALLDLSTPDLVVILAIVLLLFGGRKLPEISKGLSESIRELRNGLKNDADNSLPEKSDEPR